MVLCTDAADIAAGLVEDLYPVVAGALSVELPAVAADTRMHGGEGGEEEEQEQGTYPSSHAYLIVAASLPSLCSIAIRTHSLSSMDAPSRRCVPSQACGAGASNYTPCIETCVKYFRLEPFNPTLCLSLGLRVSCKAQITLKGSLTTLPSMSAF